MDDENIQPNQDIDAELELSYGETVSTEKVLIDLPIVLKTSGKAEKNIFMRIVEQQAVEYRVQELLSINPKTWQQLKDYGVLPQKGTYKEILVKLFLYYRQKNEAAVKKVELNADKVGMQGTRSVRSADTESGLPRVVEAEKIQKIRLDKAREEEVHLKNLATRGELINKREQYELIAPLIGNIANILRSAADDNPQVQDTIDKCFLSLYTVGEKLLAQADKDKDNYVEFMMNTPVDLEAIVDNAQLEMD